ncbi:MAG: hypothetical protein AAFR58_25110, partial [Cyanobacteria bacterium J06627_28]
RKILFKQHSIEEVRLFGLFRKRFTYEDIRVIKRREKMGAYIAGDLTIVFKNNSKVSIERSHINFSKAEQILHDQTGLEF